MKQAHIYRVAFNEPPIEGDDRKDFFYTSLSAIFDDFTPEQIGCRVSRLWNLGVGRGTPYEGRRCRITQEAVSSKKQNKPV